MGETYNIAGSNEIKNIDIVKIICDIMDELKPSKNGSYRDLITFVDDRPGHDKRYSINSKSIQKELNWQPKYSFDEGISKTILWYLNNQDWIENVLNSSGYKGERLGLKK